MAKSIKAVVVPALLIWARESAGLTTEEAAKKVPTKTERLESWENGDDQPTVNQLRKLGVAYKRPIAVFFLHTPPKGWAALRDFRRLPGNVYGQQSPRLRLEIRRARTRREVALDLLKELGEEPPQFNVSAALNDNPIELATSIRSELNVSTGRQFSWKSKYDSYNGWRDAIESKGVLVVQASRINVEEMRGFCVSDKPLPVIGVNPSDSPYGRVFSMIHELVHVALAESGISDLVLNAARPPEEQEIEVFCNRVTAEVLVPEDTLSSLPTVRKHESEVWTDDELSALSKLFGVSREVILRRMLVLGRTSSDYYSHKRNQWKEEIAAMPQTKGGPVPQERLAIGSAGPFFTRLVLNSYYREKITTSDASGYLNLRIKHFAKLENAVWGRLVMFKDAV